MAASEGIKVVLTGSVARRSGIGIHPHGQGRRSASTGKGNELTTAEAAVADKAGVLKGVESVASKLRERLGDTTPESVRRQKAETVTTASLEALQSYSIAQDLSSSGRQEESIEHYREGDRARR